jgi:hypothetical protein
MILTRQRDPVRRHAPAAPAVRAARTAHAARAAPAAAVVLAATAVGCGSAGGETAVRVERETLGDTTVVRTVAGSAWGQPATLEPEIRIGRLEGEDHEMLGQVLALAVAPDGHLYVTDGQVPALRKYAPDGSYVATFGRAGGGPGEYQRPDGGLAVLPDGRVVIRDPGNARLQVYSPDGQPLAAWQGRGGFHTSNPMIVDTAGRVRTHVLLDAQAAVTEWRSGLVAYDPTTGEPTDTIPSPTWDFEAPRLVAEQRSDGGSAVSVNSVPFSASPTWTFSPLGYMVGGLSTRYAVEQYRPDGTVLRIERSYDPVPVDRDEKANREAQVRHSMRQTQPDWRWNGPPIPDVKPPFQSLHTGVDGRIWVRLHQPGEPIPPDEIDEPRGPDPRPANRWREPIAFDVFEPDGTYLGVVHTPRGFSINPAPVFHGDHVWAVERDDLDVPYVVRYRITR